MKAARSCRFSPKGWLARPCSARFAGRNCSGSPDFMSSPVRSTGTRARYGACMSARRRAAAGIGGRLVEAVIEHARAHVELIQLTVVSENLAARRLYSGSASRHTGSKSAPRNIAAAIMTMC